MRRARRILLALVVVIVVIAMLPVLLYVPPIQSFIVGKACEILSESTGYEISVGQVRLRFPLDLSVRDILVVNGSDTIANVGSIGLEVEAWPLLDGKVVVRSLGIEETRVNTSDLISSVIAEGYIGSLTLSAEADLNAERAFIGNICLEDGDIGITLLEDTTETDSVSEPIGWEIGVGQIDIRRTSVGLVSYPYDITAYIGSGSVGDCLVSLADGRYEVGSVALDGGRVSLDNMTEPETEGLDLGHLAFRDITIGIDSLYYGPEEAGLRITRFGLKEKSSLGISDLRAKAQMDTARLEVPYILVEMPSSALEASASIGIGEMAGSVELYARLGKKDIREIISALPDGDGMVPASVMAQWPDKDLSLTLKAEGSLKNLSLNGLEMELPTAFRAEAEGSVEAEELNGDLDISLRTWNLSFVRGFIPKDVRNRIAIPYGIYADGNVKAQGGTYSASLDIREGGGSISINGYFDSKAFSYEANVGIDSLNMAHFLPNDSLKAITLYVEARGKGMDFTSPKTSLSAHINIDRLEYGEYNLDKFGAEASMDDGKAFLSITGDNDMMRGSIEAGALMSDSCVKATIGVDLRHADLELMRLSDNPFTLSVCAHLDVSTDMTESHMAELTISDVTLNAGGKTYRPQDLSLEAFTDPDTINLALGNGDLSLNLSASEGYMSIMGKTEALLDTLDRHRREKIIDGDALKALLPSLSVDMESGTDNIFANYLRTMDLSFGHFDMKLKSSSEMGIGGGANLYGLVADSIRIDTIMLGIRDDMRRIGLRLGVANNKDNSGWVFRSYTDAYMEGREIGLNTKYIDAVDSVGVALGLVAEMRDSGINVHLAPYDPILGYIPFSLNEDNYIFMGRDKRVRADVELIAENGTGVQLFSSDNDPDALQDITVSLNRFDLGKITSVIPYAPSISGMLDGDYHLVVDQEGRISVASDMSVDQAACEGNDMGDIASEFVYLQREDSTHAVEGTLSRYGETICSVEGSYKDIDGGYIDATVSMESFPLNLANGFIPDQIMGFEGKANGVMSVVGPLSQPIADGALQLDSAYIVSVPYGVQLRFDNDRVPVEKSKLTFDNYTLFSPDDDELTIKGYVDFANLDNMNMDLSVRTDNYKIVDSKKTSTSVAYGKGYISFGGRIYGAMDYLKLRGNLKVLGNTDLTYILRDSPLSTENRFEGLVTFTDFRDTLNVATVSRPSPGGLDMEVEMEIESGARITCALNVDESNYVDLEGGGELRMVYNDIDDLQLYGRYTLNEGEMKYALPVIPLKTFQIEEGSYVEFTGDIMNPTLSLAATEDVKALVSSDGGDSRSVEFKCGVKVSQTLSNMGLQFTLEAVDDITVKNELASMSDEERGKLAVTMLTTGMYLSSDNSSGFSMNNALNSFLQSEINNITNSAVKTFDLSLGIDQGADGSGNEYTDYSFKFSKRLWNNRFNFVIGGKVSDGGSSSSDGGGTMIDNVSLEYRLDNTAMRYIRLFYNKDSHDILEDDLSEYGAGFVWRKKMDKFTDLFKSAKSTSNKTESKQKETEEQEKKEE